MIEVNSYTLPNGLALVHNYDPTTAMVALNVLYNVGARDEAPGCTGLAHLFEHMMFGGSENVPDFDAALTAAGGSNNAWTSNDFTSFWDIAPAQNAETMFYLESDRMLAPTLSPRTTDIQKSVVTEEFKQQCLNMPYGTTGRHLRGLVYPASHPYSWEVIGKSIDHIQKVTPGVLRSWFKAHYAPDNAVIAVCGNISFDLARQWAVKWFGDIPARHVAPRRLPDIPDMATSPRLEVRENVPATMVTLAWLTDRYGTQAFYAADAITDILAAGKASRFYRRLIAGGDGTLASADAMITGSEHRGMLTVSARLASEDVDVDMVIERLLQQARALAGDCPPSPSEMQRIKNRHHSMFVMSNLDCLTRVQTLSMSRMHGEDPAQPLRMYDALSAEYVAGVARDIFANSHFATLIVRPAADAD